MPQWRPPNSELANVAEDIIAGRLGAVLDPADQITKGGLAHRVLDPAMPGLAHRALHQKMRDPGLLDAPAVNSAAAGTVRGNPPSRGSPSPVLGASQ